jgi:hypothetical protein
VYADFDQRFEIGQADEFARVVAHDRLRDTKVLFEANEESVYGVRRAGVDGTCHAMVEKRLVTDRLAAE